MEKEEIGEGQKYKDERGEAVIYKRVKDIEDRER